MAITPVTAVSLEVLSSLSSGTGFRDGAVLQAKVQAMLSETLARLSIEGQTVDVATTKPLPVGATLSLKASWTDGQLSLTAHAPAANASAAPHLAPATPNALGPLIDPLKIALAKIQAMSIDAMLAGDGAAESVPLPNSAIAGQSQAEPVRQTAANINAQRPENAAASQTASTMQNEPAREFLRHGTPAAERPDLVQRHGQSDPLGTPTRSESAAAFTVDIPFFFPGSAAPLRLEVTRDEEADENQGRESRARSWMVRFSAEPGGLGRIDAAISLIDGHVGVQLWAERGETAEQFRRSSPELRDALIASDLALDEVRISEGRPMEEQ